MHTQAPARHALLFVLLVGLALTLTGCGNQPVAVVNGTKITKTDFSKRLEQTYGEQVLADLILRALVDDAFAKAGLVLDDAELDAEIQKAVQSAPDQAAWEQMLASKGMTEADFREFIAFHMKVRKLATQGVDASEEVVKKFFEENKDRFAEPESVEYSMIVLSDKAQADKLAGQLKANPEQFNDLARQHSLDNGSRDNGGRYPKTPVVQVRPAELRQQLQKLQPGKIAGPFSAEGVWFLVRLDAFHAAKQPGYEEIKDTVKEAYLLDHAKQQDELMAELRKSAQIHIVDARFQKLSEYFQPATDSLPTFGSDQDAAPADSSKTAPAAEQPAAGQQPPAGTPAAQPAKPAAQPAAPAAGGQ